MRLLISILSFLIVSTLYSQSFHLKYWTVGLGSNATWFISEEYKDCESGMKYEINDTLLTYSICEKNKISEIDTVFNDTVWTKQRIYYSVPFRQSSIDSIISTLDTLKGKYIYRSNPEIMSGGIFNYSIEYKDWCCQFTMKNTFDSCALKITNLINSYLEENFRIYTPDSRWENNKYNNPIIEPCPKEVKGTYKEALEQDYFIIRKN
jgi:hypothetical protein